MLEEVGSALAVHGVVGQPAVRFADHVIAPGVTSDEGGDDEWPDIRAQILAGGSDKTASATKLAASNAAHLAGLLQGANYPGPG